MKFVALTIILAGLVVIFVCGSSLIGDWNALLRAWAALEQAHTHGQLVEMNYFNIVQSAHRIDCFFEGVGVMFGLLLLALGFKP